MKAIIALAFIVLAAISCAYPYATAKTERVVIDSVWMQVSAGKEGGGTYLISTMDGRVFKNVDSFMRWKWTSSNLHAMAGRAKGEEVEISYYGWRIGFLSQYPNIYSINGLDF